VGTYVSVLVLLSVLASVGSIVTYIIIVVANRAEPDPTGNRTSAVYHVGTAFIALWLEIAGVITIFVTLFNLIGAGSTTYVSSEVHPLGDSTIRGSPSGFSYRLWVATRRLHTVRRRSSWRVAKRQRRVHRCALFVVTLRSSVLSA